MSGQRDGSLTIILNIFEYISEAANGRRFIDKGAIDLERNLIMN